MNKRPMIIFVLAVVSGLACASDPQNASFVNATGDCDSTLVERSYTGLRGIIEKDTLVITETDTSHQLYIRHEAIPHFMGPCGEDPLEAGDVLPFMLAETETITTTGFSEQDSVIFDLEVNWDTEPLPGIIVRIEKEGD